MSEIRQQLLSLAKTQDISALGLRKTAQILGVKNPQTIKYHLIKLQEAGLIDKTQKFEHRIEKDRLGASDLISIPVLGTADAGPATHIADDKPQGCIRVSSAKLQTRNYNNLYALKVTGTSMNRADIKRQSVEDGDYVIVDSQDINPKDGDYVISVVDSLANIKKFVRDTTNNQIVLLSESSEDYMPIFIDPGDETERLINGKVIQVIKNPAHNT